MALQTQWPVPVTWRGAIPGWSLSILLMISCSACVPLRFNTSPGASGVVVDSDHHAPIAGAQVVISQLIYPPPSVQEAFTNSRPPLVTTDLRGHFSVPAERRWDFFVVPIDAFPRFGMLVVKRDGYEPLTVPFWSRSMKDLGEVVMKPTKN